MVVLKVYVCVCLCVRARKQTFTSSWLRLSWPAKIATEGKPPFLSLWKLRFSRCKKVVERDFPFASRSLRPTQTQSALHALFYPFHTKKKICERFLCMFCICEYVCMHLCARGRRWQAWCARLKNKSCLGYIWMCTCMHVYKHGSPCRRNVHVWKKDHAVSRHRGITPGLLEPA